MKPNWQFELAQWQSFAQHVRQHVKNTERLIDADMRRTARLAGLDPQIATLHAHNALCDFHAGKPWREVNYSLARRVLFLEQREWAVSRLGNRIIERAYAKFAKQFDMPHVEVQS